MKPGWKTTEFWMSMLTKALGIFALFGGGHLAVAPLVQAVITGVGGVMTAAATVGYSVSRGQAKSQVIVAAPAEIVPVPLPKQLATPMPPASPPPRRSTIEGMP